MKKLVLLSSIILLLTLLFYYFRGEIPIEITNSGLRNSLVLIGLLNTFIFLAMSKRYIGIGRTILTKIIFWTFAIGLSCHNIILTVYHTRWRADFVDARILSTDGNWKIIEQTMMTSDLQGGRKMVSRKIRAFEITGFIRLTTDLDNE